MHRLAGPIMKTERAKEHVLYLDREVRGFIENKAYEVMRYDETVTGYWSYRVRVHQQPPAHWGLVIGDILHNLRAALDHLACQLVLENGGIVTKNTYFPISETAQQFEASYSAKMRGASSEALRLVKGVQAHSSGNIAFWRLHQLDIADKHRILIPVGAAFSHITLDVGAAFETFGLPKASMKVGIKPADRQFPLRDGAELYRAPMTLKASMDPQFTFDIAFGEGEVVEGEPIIPALQELLKLTQATIVRFAKLFPPML